MTDRVYVHFQVIGIAMELHSQGRTSSTRRGRPRRLGAYLGDWELVGTLGAGEWSTVFSARPRGCPPDWPPDYAVKVAGAAGSRDRQAELLLAREATLGRELAHPHIIAVLAAHVDAPPHYLVMPLLQGGTLQDAMTAFRTLNTAHALWITRQIAEALAALHQAGWMHADVKPANIHVSPDGHATLIDLGFALRLDSPECAADGTMRGTMAYTAPEMISAAVPIDGQSDIYSLGVTLFELLTGKPPFNDGDSGQLVLAHLQRSIPDPRRALPGLHPDVARLLKNMLAKEPLRRPNAEELVERLVDLEIATLEERVA